MHTPNQIEIHFKAKNVAAMLADHENCKTWPDPFQQCDTPCWQFRGHAMTPEYRRASIFIDWFISSEFVQGYTAGNDSDWINDPERAQRCWDAAENGADGSLHAEIIADWRSAFREWMRKRNTWKNHDRFEDAVISYFDELESYHDAVGSLWQEVG